MEKKCSNCRYDLIGCPSGQPYCGHSNGYCKWESDDCPDCKDLEEELSHVRGSVTSLYNDKCRLEAKLEHAKAHATSLFSARSDLQEEVDDLKDLVISNRQSYMDIIADLARRD